MIPASLHSKSVFLLDWDGTLFDSMPAKTRTLAITAIEHLGRKAPGMSALDIQALYRQHSGKPRQEIFHLVAARYGLALTSDDIMAMSERFSELNREALSEAQPFADGMELLRVLLACPNRKVYISSSAPQEELQQFVMRKLPGDLYARLAGIFGSAPGFSKGPGHVNKILAETGCTPDACLMIGDDAADAELARAANIEAIIVDRTGLHSSHCPHAVPTLFDLCQRLK